MAAGFYRFPALGASKANDLTDAHISPGASGSSVELTARPAAPPESNPQLTGIPSAHSPAQAASAQSSPLFLKVEEQDGAVSVRAWGMCLPQHANRGLAGDPAPQYCDWGTGHGTVRDGSANVTWQEGPVLRRMKLVPAAGSLRVMLDSTYRDHRPPQHSEAHFAKSL